MPETGILHGDKGCDGNTIRRKDEERGATPNIPPKANRRWRPCFSSALYRDRDAIERMFGRLRDVRRVATRYDKRARDVLSAVCLAAIVGFWL